MNKKKLAEGHRILLLYGRIYIRFTHRNVIFALLSCS